MNGNLAALISPPSQRPEMAVIDYHHLVMEQVESAEVVQRIPDDPLLKPEDLKFRRFVSWLRVNGVQFRGQFRLK